MSDEILAPRANPHLFAHRNILARCLAQNDRGTMHHALLFTGAKGIGKATLAYHLARELLAHGEVKISEPDAADDAGFSLFGDALPAAPKPAPTADIHSPDSALFRRVASGSHTDLLTLSPAYDAKKGQEKAEIGVDIARGLSGFLSLTPAESKWRVVIIDAVDQLNNNAANAILKLLEEPPPSSILLLVCHNPAAILPTIHSRCQTVAVTPPQFADFKLIMHDIAPDIEAGLLPRLYALAAGSPGLALNLHEHKGLAIYRDLFAAITNNTGKLPASLEAIINAKNPALWQIFLYALEIAAQRILVGKMAEYEIFAGEAEIVAKCRAAHDFEIWSNWQCAAQQLLRETAVYHLDKRHILRLICDPQRLLALQH
jgi:DNA polymerase-3 subunit delta'